MVSTRQNRQRILRARLEHALDAILGVACPIVAVVLTVLAALGLLGSLVRDDSESRWFLFAFGLGNLVLALLMWTMTWLVRSHASQLRRWRVVAACGAAFYGASFLWPYLHRVWSSMQYEGHKNLSYYLWNYKDLLVNGGLATSEFGAPVTVCLFLFVLRTVLAHVRPAQIREPRTGAAASR